MNVPASLNERAQEAVPGRAIVWEDAEVVWAVHVCAKPEWWSAVTTDKSDRQTAELVRRLLDHVRQCR